MKSSLLHRSFLISFVVVLFIVASCSPKVGSEPSGFVQAEAPVLPSLTFESPSCNAQTNPMAIEDQEPMFSWIIASDGFNRSQTAYQIIVASTKDSLDVESADMWNSGIVSSTSSIHNKYQGAELKPMQKYWWKVRIWDEKETKSQWSSAQTFEMGMMNESNWQQSKWISLKKDTRTSEYRFREYKTGRMKVPTTVTSHATGYFRNEINIDKQIESARAYICGLGYYELSINGTKVGDHVLDPAPSNYDKQAYYVNYDITDHIHTGRNALGIILGNGFYGQNISWKRDPESEKDLSYGQPAVRLLVQLKYTDGSQGSYITDENWKESTGPTVFDNIYGGDTYDARFEINGWNIIGYDDTSWGQVKVSTPNTQVISAQQIPPIRRLKELTPINVFRGSNGKWVVDFGQNIAGWVRINVKEKEGQVIRIIPTEALTQSGDDIYPGSTGGGANGMKQLLLYICQGSEEETWEPKFSYHGFRYVEISGISTKPDAHMIKAILVANDVEHQGNFSSSDPMLNKMNEISKWTIEDNLHGIPEDCPHREKCGWLGDAHAFCEYALYNYDMETFYLKYMEDIRTQMRSVKGNDNTGKQFYVPTMIAPGKRTSTIAKLDWGIATIYLPWYNYIYYGDSTIITEYYSEMKGLTEYYLSFKNDKGIIDNGMGDWCPPRWDRRNNPSAMECDPVVSANAYFYHILGIMSKFAKMNNDTSFEKTILNEQTKLYHVFNNEYLTNVPGTNYKWYGSQTATVMALQFDLVASEDLNSVLDGLEYDINEIKGGHHATGIHGNRYIYTVLSKYGRSDLAYDILTTPTFPSQAYVVNFGFTTWPERQFEWEKMEGLTNSLNHPMHSGFAAYFFESIAGIKPEYDSPGYSTFTVNPIYPNSIHEATVEVPTPYGSIDMEWNRDGKNFNMNLRIPFNTKAKVELSENEKRSLSINDKAITQLKEDGLVEMDESVIIIGSGNYSFKYITD